MLNTLPSGDLPERPGSKPAQYSSSIGRAFCVAVRSERCLVVGAWTVGVLQRSTGPTAFRAERAAIARSSSGAINVSFQIELIHGGLREVRLTLRNDAMLEERTGLRVRTEHKASIEVPELPPYSRAR
jgi:hypothetical protein